MNLLRTRPDLRREFRAHFAVAAGLHHLAEGWAGLLGDQVPDPVIPRTRPLRTFRARLAIASGIVLLATAAIFLSRPALPDATTISSPGTEWRFEAGGLDGKGNFLPETRVKVNSGRLLITLRSGTSMVLEGPSIIGLRDSKTVVLQSGSAWFSAAPGNEDFTVLSPRLHTTNPSARFGIMVTPQEDRLHVGSGRVTTGSRLAGQPSGEVLAGHAIASNENGLLTDIRCQTGVFQQSLEDRGVLHWSFDDAQTGMRSGPGSSFVISLMNRSATPELVEGRFGQALDLGPTGAFSDFEGIFGASPRTVALWVKGNPVPPRYALDGRAMNPSLVAWGTHDEHGNKWQVAIFPNGDGLVTQWGGAWVSTRPPSGTSLLDDRWHHIVSVFTGLYGPGDIPEIRHYIDGVRVPDGQPRKGAPIDTRTDLRESRPLILGLNDWPDLPKASYPWAIDELWIARRPLNDAEVERLFKENILK